MEKERWRWVSGYEGYYKISDQGRVKSVERIIETTRGPWTVYARFLVPTPAKIKKGSIQYPMVKLAKNGKNKNHYIHRMVLEAFKGPCPVGKESCHKNGDPSDFSLNNLRWGTALSNHEDKIAHGTRPVGSKNGAAVLNEDKVRKIKLRLRQGALQEDLADIFGVSASTISFINLGKRWAHIKI